MQQVAAVIVKLSELTGNKFARWQLPAMGRGASFAIFRVSFDVYDCV